MMRGNEADVVVVGAGPGGLGVAAMAKRRGLRPVVLERGQGPGAKWRTRYDRLRINTSTLTAFLPGKRYPLGYGRWPSRDQLVAYYEEYAREHELDIRTLTEAVRVDRDGDRWVVATSGEPYRAAAVVVATGKDGAPRIPAWLGRRDFVGEIVHASAYRNAAPFAGRRVLVVGAGSSALDICLDLVEGGAADVLLAIRTPPHLVRRAFAGIPSDLLALTTHRLPRPVIDALARRLRMLSFGDLSRYGLQMPQDGFTSRLLERGMIPTIDPGPFVPALKRGDIRVVGPVERLEPGGAVLADGATVDADAIVAPTGYGRGLEPLVGHLDGVLDERGNPVAPPPGLHFIGFTDVLTGNLREMRRDAKRIAKRLAPA